MKAGPAAPAQVCIESTFKGIAGGGCCPRDIQITMILQRHDRSSSGLGNHDLEILAGYYQRVRAGNIPAAEQLGDRCMELQLPRGIERAKRLVRRSIKGPEHLDPMGC